MTAMGPDMKFVNNSKDAVAIRAKFADQKLTISIVGIPILEEDGRCVYEIRKGGRTRSSRTELRREPDTGAGGEAVKQPVNGSRWVTNLVKEKDGKVAS